MSDSAHAMDHVADYCALRRTEIAELIAKIARRERVLFTDGRFRTPSPNRVDGLIHEYTRMGELMRSSTEIPDES